MMDKSPEH